MGDMKLLNLVAEPYTQDPTNLGSYIIRGLWQKDGKDKYFSVLVDDPEVSLRSPLWWDDLITSLKIAFKSP